MRDGVRTVILWHEFGHRSFSFAFVVAVVVLSEEHHKVSNLVNIVWGAVFVGVVCLTDFGSKKVVLSLLDIKGDVGYDLVSHGLFTGSIRVV